MNTHTRKILSLAVAAATAGFVSPVVIAQQDAEEKLQLEEVIVTAERREANLQDTPIAISAFGSEALETYGVSDLGDIEGIAPSLSVTPFPNSKSTLVLFIRGVGNNDAQTTQDPAVGVYMDGVYLGRAVGLTSDVADLERVEVLRGPQGTLYGRNTTGGAVNLVTAKPGEDFGFSQQYIGGNEGVWTSKTTIESGDFNGFRAKFTGMTGGKDGRVENLGGGEQNFGSEDKQAARLALSWDVSETVSIDYSYDQSEIEGPQEYYQVLRPGTNASAVFTNNLLASGFNASSAATWSTIFLGSTIAQSTEDPLEEGFWSRPVENSKTEVGGHGVTVTWDINEDMTFKSITGARDIEESVVQDYSGGPSPVFLVDVDIEQEQFSQEFQLIGNLDEKFAYVAGLYYFTEDSTEIELDRVSAFVPDGSMIPDPLGGPGMIQGGVGLAPFPVEYRIIDSENSSVAGYGQLTWSVSDKLDVTTGLRYTLDDRAAKKASINFTFPTFPTINTPYGTAGVQSADKVFTKWTPSITADYQINETMSTYAKLVSGYKSGGFNVRSTEEGFQPPFEEESMLSVEFGWKSSLAEDRVRLNAALFQSKYKDMQIQQITDVTKIFLTDVYNAGEATISGFELDMTALLFEGMTLDLNYAYVDAEFDEVLDGTTGADITDFYVMPYAPESSYNVSLNYFKDIGFADLVAMLNYNWRDDQYGTADSRNDLAGFELEAYGLLNARIGLANVSAFGMGTLDFGIWGKNLTDEEYLVHSISQGTTHNGYFGDPITYGVDVKYTFGR